MEGSLKRRRSSVVTVSMFFCLLLVVRRMGGQRRIDDGRFEKRGQQGNSDWIVACDVELGAF